MQKKKKQTKKKLLIGKSKMEHQKAKAYRAKEAN